VVGGSEEEKRNLNPLPPYLGGLENYAGKREAIKIRIILGKNRKR